MTKFVHIILFLCIVPTAFCQDASIVDSRHYSNVFGEIRNFRIFLPKGYAAEKQKRYPVIYFFHGWGQRYFGEGSDEYAGYDKGDQNNGDNIANYVAKHDVIVVKADGYNRRNNEEYYRRPYNVLPVETYRQFPIYFPELVNFVDGHYRTMADRQHRAVSGLSMGGFMTFSSLQNIHIWFLRQAASVVLRSLPSVQLIFPWSTNIWTCTKTWMA